MIQYYIKYYLNTISPKGRIAWEYNPLHNFRRTKDTDENGLHYNLVKVYGQLFTLISSKEENNITTKRYKDLNGQILIIKSTNDNDTEAFLNGENLSLSEILKYNESDLIEAGSIVDFDTELLNFSLNNPVQIEAQPSYDGSVNLILNDLRNPPRLINSRFSTRQLNTYEIVDRIGDNDTNIYDDDINQFDIDTSLYKKYTKIPKVIFNKVLTGGNLKVGNYVLYFRYCDADDNETDFVAESGIISIFKGNDKDPFSIDGGITDMNTHKSIDITLTNIDEAYDYVKVYYSRTSSDFDLNRQVSAFKLIKKFVVSRKLCHIILNGDEQFEIIPTSELNNEYFIAETVKTLAQCLNRLFLGNISRPDPLHQDLTDISIRMLPYYKKHNTKTLIGYVNPKDYTDNENIINNYEYYNTKNIYYNLGYWDEEIYRIGVVYVMYDNTLSKVYNIRGCERLPEFDEIKTFYTDYLGNIFDEFGNREYIKVSEENYSIIDGKYLENARGVVRFNDINSIKDTATNDYVYSLKVFIPEEVFNYLKNYCGIKGLFFVRQKRIPTILAQGLTIPIDPESRVPLIYSVGEDEDKPLLSKNQFGNESFLSQESIKIRHKTLFRHSKYQEKELTHDYSKRIIYASDSESDKIENSQYAAIICPDYEIRQLYYNQFFTGTTFPISYSSILYGDIKGSDNRERFYTNGEGLTRGKNGGFSSAKLVSVTEEVPTVAIGENVFRSVCGVAQEAYRFRYAFRDGNRTKSDTNLLRGIWHPYVAGIFKDKVSYGKLINIHIPGYNISELLNYYKVRYDDNSPYYPIGDRMGLDDITSYPFSDSGYQLEFFRGDCYICTFTHRLNRNFQDPTAPANDLIVDKDSWTSFDPEDETTFDKVNLGDVNAIKMGSWYTFKLRSSTNLSIRSLDESHLEEKGLFGLPRGFYPLQQELISGNNKIPDSYNVNDGFRSLFGEKIYMRYPDVPYIKNNFENRILYSDIAVNDAFRNGYRVFKSTNFNDYTKEYGSIIKLVTMMNSEGLLSGLLCVFEHGIAYIPVQERTVAGQGAGGTVYINTSNILPDNPRILSDKFGSQWQDSIIQTPYYTYGVDTVAKKIWRTNGGLLEVISDFKVNKFLIDNISLTEKELTPIIGVRNVKTHYNANKSDVMFTFYDNLYGTEEKAWNLCWNEINNCFVTFYSWIPSYSENIDNIYFSFDRESSKSIAKLGTSQVGSTNADGIVLNHSVIKYIVNKNSAGDIINDENSEQLIPEYGSNNDTFDIDNIVLKYSKFSNTFIYKDELYYKQTNGMYVNADYFKTILKSYVDTQYACNSWNILDSTYLSDVMTTRVQTEIVGLENRITPSGSNLEITYDYEILKDPYGNWRYFILADEYERIPKGQNGSESDDDELIKHTVLKFWPNCTPYSDFDDPIPELDRLENIQNQNLKDSNGITILFNSDVVRPKHDEELDLMESHLNEYINEYDRIIGNSNPRKNLTEAVYNIRYYNDKLTNGIPALSAEYKERIESLLLLDNTISGINNLKTAYNYYITLRNYIRDFNRSVVYDNIDTPQKLNNILGSLNLINAINNFATNYTGEYIDEVNAIKSYLLTFSLVTTNIPNIITKLQYEICKNNRRINDRVTTVTGGDGIDLCNNNGWTYSRSKTMKTWIDNFRNYIINKKAFMEYADKKINLFNSKKVWYVYVKCNISVGRSDVDDWDAYAIRWDNEDLRYNYGYYTSVIAVTSEKVFNNYVKYEYDDGHYTQIKHDDTCEVLSTDFWKHGQAGIIDIKDEIEPCLWYGKQHPFEFEFVVRDTPNAHKIFDNLEIVSNKAEPESFHFEVVGETYEFHPDKKNMYVRQELTKKMWLELGIDMTYDHNVNKLTPRLNIKSTIFPLYYNRIDTFDNIYDSYTKMNGDNRDYRNLSGSEIVWDKQLNEFRILTHIKNTPVTKAWNEVPYSEYMRYPEAYRKEEGGRYYVWKDTGRIRGNSHYKEDRWKILIPSITFMLKNERNWINEELTYSRENVKIPPIVINYIPDEYPCTFINNDILPNIYNMSQTKTQVSNGNYKLEEAWPDEYNHENDIDSRKTKWGIDAIDTENYWIDTRPWTYRKEAKIRDKYLKVRVRYEGSLLAIIQAVLTTYTESYA